MSHPAELPITSPESPVIPTGCPSQLARQLDRRAFLRQTALTVAAALVAGGLAPSEAFASQVRSITATSAAGRERTYEIPATDGVSVDTANDVVLARSGGLLHAFSLACPHRGATLQWKAGEQHLYCPKHKARFGTDGAHVSGRATRDLDRFALRRNGNAVVVLLDQKLSANADAAAWKAAALAI
jgi:cytochrome b6-f complex iron-sulfur subunit